MYRPKAASVASLFALCLMELTIESISIPAQAQSASTTDDSADQSQSMQVEDIIVTAQRSAQNLQRVPIAITAIQSSQLRALQVESTKDIDQLVPGLVMNRKSNAVQPFIRGIGANSSAAGVESPVATYVDGVYIPTPAGATFDLPDVERIEVLKGPQGTLFGRNATSGALNVVTRQPSATPSLEAELGYGNYDTITARAYATAPLSDTLRANASFYVNDQRDGWGDVTSPDGEGDSRKGRVIATRAKLAWIPAADLSFEAGAYFMHNRGDLTSFAASPNVLHRVPAGPAAGQLFVNSGLYDSTRTTSYQGFTIKHYGGHLKSEITVGDVQFINTAAYQKLDATTYTPVYGGIPFASDPVLAGLFTDETFSDELRAQYSSDRGDRFLAGLYYLDEKLKYNQFNFNTRFPPYTGGAIDDLKTVSKAAFADGTVALGSGLSLTGGIRYTRDSRALSKIQIYSAATGAYTNFAPRNLTSSKVTYRIVGQWQASDDAMVYLSQSRGYKAGFFNLGAAAPSAPPLEPELLTAREAGFKSELFNRRLRVNIAAFWNSYTNIVVQQTVTTNGLTSTFQTNAARARTVGLEADFNARLTQHFSLSGGLAYLPTAKYVRYPNAVISNYNPATGAIISSVGDATGNRLIQAPRFEGQAQAYYDLATPIGTLAFATNLAYRSRIFLLADNRLSQSPVAIVNASAKLTLPDDHHSLSFWIKNLTDKGYLTDAVNSGGVDIIVPGSPRTYGLTLKATY